MAVDVCSEISSPVVSPRISFSHDLKELDFVPVESNALQLNPTIDFDFCTAQTFSSHEISSADELFANGQLLPVEIKKITPPKEIQIHQTKPNKNVEDDENTKKKRLIEFLATSFDDADEEEEKPMTKPFWQFRRSSSVNCDHNCRANGLIGRSLQFLTRSNSTGSVPNPKPSGYSKVMQKQHSLKESSTNRQSSSVPSSLNQYYPYNNGNTSKKPTLRTSTSRSYNNGIRISPVLNIPPTYIAKGTVSLFGIGSFFCSKKSKKKRK